MKPYNLLLWSGVALVVSSLLFVTKNQTIDLHLHDTYFVIAHTQVVWFLASFALLIWATYLITNKYLYSHLLTWAHVICTILTIAILAVILFVSHSHAYPVEPNDVNLSTSNSFETSSKIMNILGVILAALMLGQFLYLINIVAGLVKKYRHS